MRHSSIRRAALGATALSLLGAAAHADQVIVDDLIVDGSACIGLDCINGESFGFDTLRLKENNLRIGFSDTSSSSSFPTNDWEITINDSDNGGANYFGVTDFTAGRMPFRVEGGAPANALVVESDGDIGMGTINPVVEVHVVDGDSPTLRLEQDGSAGFTPQTWDIAGNEAGFFVRDVTNGSSLGFRILPAAPAASLVIEGTTGDVGIGASTNPAAALHVKRSNGLAQVLIEEVNGTETIRDMLVMKNNGDSTLIFTNTAAGAPTPEWKLASFQGNLFMGTPTSAGAEFLLSNTGNLTISGTLTTGSNTNYPDYVFEDDYQLMPLSDLDAYIAANGHLPKIPKAEDVAETGINLTEMQIALLEKVEELTLYTLEQHTTIQQQGETIAVLLERLERLED